jgi:hypothetical protein
MLHAREIDVALAPTARSSAAFAAWRTGEPTMLLTNFVNRHNLRVYMQRTLVDATAYTMPKSGEFVDLTPQILWYTPENRIAFAALLQLFTNRDATECRVPSTVGGSLVVYTMDVVYVDQKPALVIQCKPPT